MLVLIACEIDDTPDDRYADVIVYLPGLAGAHPQALAAELARVRPQVLVLAAEVVDAGAFKSWRDAQPDDHLLVMYRDRPSQPPADVDWVVTPDSRPHNLLITAERRIALRRRRRRVTHESSSREVVVVGAGIVGLLTASCLQQQGWDVHLYESAPDPRDVSPWQEFGCTMGGGNARMFTLTEADVYLTRELHATPASEGGWRVRADVPLSLTEQRWLEAADRAPEWLLAGYAADVYRVNKIAGRLWARLRERDASLFDGVNLIDGIVRLYSDVDQWRGDIARHERLGAEAVALTSGELKTRVPALGDACDAGMVAGSLVVPGFTLQVHELIRHLVDRLADGGARLHWRTSAQELQWEGPRIAALRTSCGDVAAAYYVISPGVPQGDLLRGCTSEGAIQGVLGLWLTLPDIAPGLPHSLKIARRNHLANDTNVTVIQDETGASKLLLGSGYGWTGTDPRNIDMTQLATINQSLHDTARRYFPQAYALRDPEADTPIRYCTRPWTASSLPVFETAGTTHGGKAIIIGGHNTGGFAQAPAVAAAVVGELSGRGSRMAALYHPDRPRNTAKRTRGRVEHNT